jgi:peptidyl-prolyl cis-trans isomerase C
MKKLIVILAVVMLACDAAAGSDDAPVAKVGTRTIGAAELTERFELTPWNKEIQTLPVETSKTEFLYTLIAEKLWAQKAVELGLDTSVQVRAMFASLEKMFVRDALYRQEVMDKVTAAAPNARGIEKDLLTVRYRSDFMTKFFKDKSTDVNGKVYQAAASSIVAIIRSKRMSMQADDTTAVYLEAADFTGLKRSLGQDLLQRELIRYGGQRSTLSEFLDYLHYDENAFTSSDTRKIKEVLGGKLRAFMQGEYLAQEGYKRNLANLPDVKSQLRIWKDNYLMMALRGTFKDSLKISDEDVREYYERRMKANFPAQVRIVEVLTDDLNVVEKVLQKCKTGADLHELAARYSKRDMTKASRGEFGFFPVTSFGEIGRQAGRMNVGELAGPIKTEEGYSVFKLLDRKEEGKQDVRPFDEVKDELRRTLQGMKHYHGLVNYTVRLANEYGISIDKKVLDAIEVTRIFAVTYRYMGFGGRILGAPLIGPNTEWVVPWKTSRKDNL